MSRKQRLLQPTVSPSIVIADLIRNQSDCAVFPRHCGLDPQSRSLREILNQVQDDAGPLRS